MEQECAEAWILIILKIIFLPFYLANAGSVAASWFLIQAVAGFSR